VISDVISSINSSYDLSIATSRCKYATKNYYRIEGRISLAERVLKADRRLRDHQRIRIGVQVRCRADRYCHLVIAVA